MKRVINNLCDDLFEKLTTYVAVLNFKYLNLCIKAEEASLIPIKVNVEGKDMNLEQVALIAKKDDYRFWLIPKYDEDIPNICEGVSMVHPEFKQKIDSVTIDTVDIVDDMKETEKEVTYIELTMPEVNDDRYDVLKEGVDFFYQECKTQMEAAVTKTSAEITFHSVGESKEDIESVKATIEKMNNLAAEQRDKLHEKKLKEIEESYQNWIAKVEGRGRY